MVLLKTVIPVGCGVPGGLRYVGLASVEIITPETIGAILDVISVILFHWLPRRLCD